MNSDHTPVYITGIGTVLPCGEGVATFKQALEAGATLYPQQTSSHGLDTYVPAKLSRRMDPLTRMAILATYLAFKDADITLNDRDKEETGIVFGSSLGSQASTFSFLDSFIDGGDLCASSFAFTNSVHSIAPSQVALNLGLRGPIRTITTLGYTAGAALAAARNWLHHQTVKRVVLILAEDSHPVFTAGMEKMGVAPSLAHGEGCYAFVLETRAAGYCQLGPMALNLAERDFLGQTSTYDRLFCSDPEQSQSLPAYHPATTSFYNPLAFQLTAAALAQKAVSPHTPLTIAAAANVAPHRFTLIPLLPATAVTQEE